MGINKVQYGNTTLIDLTSDTVTADKLLQGYTAHDRTGAIITGTATGGGGSVTQDQDGFIVLPPTGGGGGGGASNIVFGNFTAGTAGNAQTVNIDYSGNGYPVYVGIYPSDGFVTSSSLYTATHQYAIVTLGVFKSYMTNAPNYTDSSGDNQAYGAYLYKTSATAGSANGATRINGATIYNNADATSSSPYMMRIKSKNSISVYVSDASYGFHTGTTYNYVIVYSE